MSLASEDFIPEAWTSPEPLGRQQETHCDGVNRGCEDVFPSPSDKPTLEQIEVRPDKVSVSTIASGLAYGQRATRM